MIALKYGEDEPGTPVFPQDINKTIRLIKKQLDKNFSYRFERKMKHVLNQPIFFEIVVYRFIEGDFREGSGWVFYGKF